MKRFGSECAIKKQNGPNKEGTAPPGYSLHGSVQGRVWSASPETGGTRPPVNTTHTYVERKAQYISFSYHGGVTVSAHLTASTIWPATVEMQSECAAEAQKNRHLLLAGEQRRDS